MADNKYNVHPEMIKSVNYKVLVLGLPDEDLEDLLTHFVIEKGKISRSLYEDFLIGNCIGNLNQFTAHIQAALSTSGELDLIAVRKEVVDVILTYNPLLSPDNIIINKNQVLKVKDGAEHDGILLTENTYWNKSYYDSEGKYTPISGAKDEDDSTKSIRKDQPRTKDTKEDRNNDNKSGIKPLNEIEWQEVQVWWDRINEYITIKKYSLEDIDHVVKQRYFHNRTSFNAFIVSNCVLHVEEIYERIEGMGVNVDPNKVVRELFALCEGVNEGMNFKKAKELQPEDEDEEKDCKSSSSPNRRAQAGNGSSKKKSKPKSTFRDIPKVDLLKLSDNMKVYLVGQDEAVDSLSEAIKRASVGLKDPIKPIGSFMFAGRTGCGKSLAGRVLADELIKAKKNRIVIDCSEYTADHEYAKLIGAPAGYIGYDSGGILTNAISEDPFSVVVFDEVEKASSKVHALMLQILDEGRLTDGKGNVVSFKDSIIIMTSNIGVKEVDDVAKTIGFGDVAVLTEDKKGQALDKALKSKFKPEFLNRIDSTIYFKDLKKKDYMRIIDIELYKLSENLKNNDTEYKDIELSFDDKVRDFIYANGVDEKFGARPIKRAIEKHVSTKIAEVLLRGDFVFDACVNVSVRNNKVTVSVMKPSINIMREG